jgi:hypothetical protein
VAYRHDYLVAAVSYKSLVVTYLAEPIVFRSLQKEGVALPSPEGISGTEGTSTTGTASNPSDSVAASTPVKHDGPGIGTPGSGSKRAVDSLSREELILLVHKMRARIKLMEKRHAGQGSWFVLSSTDSDCEMKL